MRATSTVTAASLVTAVGLLALAADRVRGHGMAVRDAIQVLYAGMRESEMAAGVGGSPATYLDEATSRQAKYVADTLQRMIGEVVETSKAPVAAVVDKTAAHVAEHKLHRPEERAIDASYDDDAAGENDDIGARIDRLMNKCMEATLAKNRKDANTKNHQSTARPLVDVYALERRLSDLLEQFVRASSAASGASATLATARLHRRYKASPPAPYGSDVAGSGLFTMFNKQLVSSADAPVATA